MLENGSKSILKTFRNYPPKQGSYIYHLKTEKVFLIFENNSGVSGFRVKEECINESLGLLYTLALSDCTLEWKTLKVNTSFGITNFSVLYRRIGIFIGKFIKNQKDIFINILETDLMFNLHLLLAYENLSRIKVTECKNSNIYHVTLKASCRIDSFW